MVLSLAHRSRLAGDCPEARRYFGLVSTLPLLAGLGMVAATAFVVARRLAPPTATGFVLAVYLLGFTEIVGVTLALSIVGSVFAWTVLATIALLLVTALTLCRSAPRATALSRGITVVRTGLRDPIVAVLAIAVGAGYAYSAALGLLTPPNDWDAMTYHLARAAFWIQQHGVGYVPESDVLRINVNPPNAEIGSLFTMLLSGGDRYVGGVQYAAAAATAVGIMGISGRVGLGHREKLFGALTFLSLPIVLLQSSTALNDLVVASFLVAATCLLLGSTRVEFGLGAVALALAVGTKFTALIALPLLALVVLAIQPRRRWSAVSLWGVAGVAAGSYWLVVNLAKTGSLEGNAGSVLDQHPDRSPSEVLARTTRILVNFADDLNLERDLRLYPVAAALAAIAVFIVMRNRRRRWVAAVAVVVVGSLPAAMTTIHELFLRAHEKLWITLGEQDLAFLDKNREAWSPSTVLSYYGALGLMLVVIGIGATGLAARRTRLSARALLLSASPIALALLVALALVYDPWRARFLAFGFALAASTWGLLLGYRWLGWGVASIATVTVLLSFVHSIEKPTGVALLEPTGQGVWGQSRETVQTWLRPDGTAEIVDYFAEQPETGRVGLRVGEDDWVYPYFGHRLGREVFFVRDERPDPSLDWLVAGPGRTGSPRTGWSIALRTSDGWRVYRAPRRWRTG
jgi:hypothetical protein